MGLVMKQRLGMMADKIASKTITRTVYKFDRREGNKCISHKWAQKLCNGRVVDEYKMFYISGCERFPYEGITYGGCC